MFGTVVLVWHYGIFWVLWYIVGVVKYAVEYVWYYGTCLVVVLWYFIGNVVPVWPLNLVVLVTMLSDM